MPTIVLPDDGPPFQALLGLPQPGQPGPAGPPGAAGVGVPTGGTTGQSLVKQSNTNYDTIWQTITGGGGSGFTLTATPVKTATYTAAVNDLVRVNVSGGAFAVNLPSAPADHSIVGVIVDTGHATNQVTVTRGGSDTFAGGATTKVANVQGQIWIGQYNAGVWYPITDFLRSLSDSTTLTLNTATPGLATFDVNATQSLRVLQLDSNERIMGVRLSTAAQPADFTYANGTSGLGATITFVANGQQSFDDTLANLNDWVLIQHTPSNHPTNYEYCGLYQVTTQGGTAGAAPPAVLTRVPEENFTQGLSFFVADGVSLKGATFKARFVGTPTYGTTKFKYFGHRPTITPAGANFGVFRDRLADSVHFARFTTTQNTNGEVLVGDGGVLWFSGTGAQASQDRVAATFECCALSTGTTATGYAAWSHRSASQVSNTGLGRMRVAFRVAPTAVPTTADLFVAKAGLINGITTGTITDGMYFALAYTSVAAGSNGVNTSTFAGAGTLNVASTASFPAAGTITAQTGGTPATITYTGITGTTFTGCTTTAGGGALATGGMVNFANWTVVCRSSNVETAVDTTSAVTASPRNFVLEYDDVTGNVTFWPALLTPIVISTNVPTSALQPGALIAKLAGTTAVTLRLIESAYDIGNPTALTRYWP